MVKVSDMWQETCLVAITRKGGSDVNFAAKSDDLGFGQVRFETHFPFLRQRSSLFCLHKR